MADPIITDWYRAQVVFQGQTGKPEDVYVNNFVFRNEDIVQQPADVADAIRARIEAFFKTTQQNGSSVQQFLSSAQIKPDVTIKVYDLGQPAPRLPIMRTFNLPALSTAPALPAEVCACLSYYAQRPLPRQRGRVYLGPLVTSAIASNNGRVALATPFMTTVLQAAAGLISGSGTGPVTWGVLSQRDATARPITGGWMDDAPDTQRRRGVTPLVRTTWGAPPQ